MKIVTVPEKLRVAVANSLYTIDIDDAHQEDLQKIIKRVEQGTPIRVWEQQQMLYVLLDYQKYPVYRALTILFIMGPRPAREHYLDTAGDEFVHRVQADRLRDRGVIMHEVLDLLL